MNETQRRIQAYKEALPGLRERVIAVALLLAMSAAMMTSATFAWITLSRAPELSNVSTTVAANGNLEIALVQPSGEEPGASKVGDSSAATDQSVVKANLTWGNLVNLSDPSYGLNNLVLRPALLGNTNNLLQQPLKGVDYGTDGRVDLLYNEDYQFANWTIQDDGKAYFEYSAVPKYGVRAISTIKYTFVNNRYYGYTLIRDQASAMRNYVVGQYEVVTNNQGYIKALAGLIGDFMTDQLNDSNTDVSAYVTDMYHMLLDIYYLMSGSEDLVYCFEDAMAELANAQVYLHYQGDKQKCEEHHYTKEKLMSSTNAELAADGVNLPVLQQYKTLKTNIETVLYGTDSTTNDCLYDYYRLIHTNSQGELDESFDNGTAVMRADVMPYVNKMVDIGSTKITCEGETNTVTQLTASKSKAVGLLGKKVDGVIAKGYLKDFEQIVGGRLNAQNVVVSAYYITTVSITAKTITTAASQPYEFDKDLEATNAAADADKGDYTGMAQDTYGMALDFWVRTNANDSYLVLEGNVLTQTTHVRATGVARDGTTVELWTANVSTEVTGDDGTVTTVAEDYAVYKMVETVEGEEKEVWYYLNNHSQLYKADGSAPDGQTISTPIERYEEVVDVIGYEGENRVWDTEKNIFLDVTSTTQGNGSCYVFYAEDPAQQENSLRLLSNLRVAFVDSNTESATYGKMVAIAHLNTERSYEENGKVTVPLELMDDGSSFLTETEEGLAIMPLEQNVATRLTAIVFLDGREISNSEVLAANDIHGQLNIQFGSSKELSPVSDERLESQTRSISAVIKLPSASTYPATNNGPTFNDSGEITSNPDVSFSYDEASDENPMIVDVKVTVMGDAPNQMTAFFMRKVNATQGSREVSFPLIESETEPGVFVGQYTFTAPGEYVLRTVQLDGVDYELPAKNYPRVMISGFGIEHVTMKQNGTVITAPVTKILTGDRTVSTELSVKLASSKKLPTSVRLQYVKDDGTQVTTNLVYNTTTFTWDGKANFTSSGEYTLRYIILDGEYTELAEQYQKSLDISMGITVSVIDGVDEEGNDFRNRTYTGEPFSVPMYVEIFDDSGEELRYLSGVKVVYARGNSEINNANPDLIWNPGEDRYVGNIQIPGPGVYTFKRVMVGNSPLSKTRNTAPTFTCVSPDPPAYKDAQNMAGKDYLVATGNDGYTIGVRLKDAAGATVTPYINGVLMSEAVNPSKTVTIDGESISEFEFTLPTDPNTGFQSGEWTITGLMLTNVYTGTGENLVFHDESNPLIWTIGKAATNDIQTEDDLHVKVVNVVVALSNDTVDGKPAVTDELELDGGFFMGTALAAKTITVTVSDQNGAPLDTEYVKVSAPQMVYKYLPRSSETHGHYYSDAEANLADITLTGTLGSDGKTFTMSKPTFTYAGQYDGASLTFRVTKKDSGEILQSFEYTSEERYDVRNPKPVMDMPVYIMKTEAPVVTIDAISPAPGESHRFNVTTLNDNFTYTTDSPTLVTRNDAFYVAEDKLSATVYIYTQDAWELLGSDMNRHNVEVPSVTLALSGIAEPTSGNEGLSSAYMRFENASSSEHPVEFNFDTSMKAKANVGYAIDGEVNALGSDTGANIYYIGKQSQNKLTIVYNKLEFEVTLDQPITLNQPQYPPYVNYKVNDSTFKETLPGNVYSTNGETVTFTLPTYASWSYETSSSKDGEYAKTGNVLTDSVYTSKKGTVRYTHTQYTRTQEEYQATSATTKWIVTKEITGWKIGDTVYKPGETVTIDVAGNQAITAVIKTTNGTKTTVTTIATKYYVTYTATGNTKTNFSSTYGSYGTQVTSVTAGWTSPTYTTVN